MIRAAGANDTVNAVALQDDEKILVAGNFTRVGSTNRNHIARLTQIGQLDVTFDPGAGADNPVSTLALQPDGRILIGGDFATFNGGQPPRHCPPPERRQPRFLLQAR